MANKQGPAHVVVDGSNIATEGRSMPSLQQLSEAVMSFMEEHPDTAITVVVDATFGHRIAKNEIKEFEEGISNNELVAPPAGAVGRGDAFVLGIANKAGATVLSNDSFQEFHGDYEWLFDEGRLIGGKPVPHVGWVWVARNPVRGPVSRKATRGGGSGGSGSVSSGGSSRSGGRGSGRSGPRNDRNVRVGSPEANAPMPIPKTPPPSARAERNDSPSTAAITEGERADGGNDGVAARGVPRSSDPVNELLPFLEFVEHHPIGTSVNGTVDAYSSHGAYITIGTEHVRGYIPLRMMADPTPRSAKSIMKIGESVTVVVASFAAARRSIDCALPDMATRAIAEAAAAAAEDSATTDAAATGAKIAPVKKSAAKKAPARKSAAKKATAKKATRQRATGAALNMHETAEETPAKKSAAKKATARKSAAKKATTKKTTAKKTTAKKATAKKSAATKTSAKKSAATSAAVPDSPAAKTSAKKSPAKTVAARKTQATKTLAKKTLAKKTPAKKSTAKKVSAQPSIATRQVDSADPVREDVSKEMPSGSGAPKSGVQRIAARQTPIKKIAAKEVAAPKQNDSEPVAPKKRASRSRSRTARSKTAASAESKEQ